MKSKTIAIIVGTGLWKSLSDIPLLNKVSYQNTPVHLDGKTTNILHYEMGMFEDLRVIILPRHGTGEKEPQRSPAELVRVAAHEAHIWFLAQLEVEAIYAFNTVGALDENIPLSDTHTFLIPDQLGYGLGVSPHSFGTKAKYPHPEMNQIMSEGLRANLCEAVHAAQGVAILESTYIHSNIDHLETRVEGKALKRLFIDAPYPVVGSTAGAECVLSKEMGIPYAVLCSVANYVQGISHLSVNHHHILKIMEAAGKTLVQVIQNLLIIHGAQTLCKH